MTMDNSWVGPSGSSVAQAARFVKGAFSLLSAAAEPWGRPVHVEELRNGLLGGISTVRETLDPVVKKVVLKNDAGTLHITNGVKDHNRFHWKCRRAGTAKGCRC
jgi:hypothetical protein